MQWTMTDPERNALETAAAAEPRVRRWRRYQAVLLLAEGQAPATVAHTVPCRRASVYAWAAAWREAGVAGLQEGDHGGGRVTVDAGGEALLTGLLGTDPQAHGHHATGWTVPLLQTELATTGYPVGDHTLRRALHRLGYRGKRPQYVLGRPDPAYAETRGPSSPRRGRHWPRGRGLGGR
jgi:transposase